MAKKKSFVILSNLSIIPIIMYENIMIIYCQEENRSNRLSYIVY